MRVKREVSEENRKFKFNWEETHFFANNNGKPQCFVRLEMISVQTECLFKEELQHQT